MKTIILDYSLWRCGGELMTYVDNPLFSAREPDGSQPRRIPIPNPNSLGKGSTLLNNDEGYMCCLGQASLQLNKGLTREAIKGIDTPQNLKCLIEPLTEEGWDSYWDTEKGEEVECESVTDTVFSEEAIDINDNPKTTPQQKIEMLTKLFADWGYELEVVNMPEEITISCNQKNICYDTDYENQREQALQH